MASKPTGRSREYFDVVKAIGECKSKLEVRRAAAGRGLEPD